MRTVDLLILTSLNQVIFRLKILFTIFTTLAILMRRSTVLSLPIQQGFSDARSSLVYRGEIGLMGRHGEAFKCSFIHNRSILECSPFLQYCFNKVVHLPVQEQSKRGRETSNFSAHCDVTKAL
jgi:hypothetical protein